MAIRPLRALVIVTAITAAGCIKQTAVSRAANDFDCASEHVTVEDLGGHSFRIRGCGHAATYTCIANAEGHTWGPFPDWSCLREAADSN